MSIKENVDFVKEELNNEEKFIESFVKAERFYKKYKIIILTLIVLTIAGLVFYGVKQNIDENNKIEANLAFNKLLSNPNDKEALEVLKNKNTNLYEIMLYIQARNEDKNIQINVPYLKELSLYSEAVKAQNIDKLNNISTQNDFLLKEFALFHKALILSNEGKYEEAKKVLASIPKTSKANELANLLNHFLLTK